MWRAKSPNAEIRDMVAAQPVSITDELDEGEVRLCGAADVEG